MSGESDHGQDRVTNMSQLRARIDAGETGDKISFPDPAAAPLGVDDEAGGAPLRPSQVAAAAAREMSRNMPTERPDREGRWVWVIILVVVLVIAAAASVLYWPAV